jgi:hypothetical protein
MNIRRMIRVSLSSVLACLTLVGMVGCLGDNDNSNPQPDPVAFVSIYNASPDAPALDIVVDGRQINSSPFEYADNSGYLRFKTGQRNFQFSPFNASNVVIDSTVTFENQKAYSVFFVNEYENSELLILNDNSDAPASGKAKIRFINLSPDAGAVSLNVEGDTTKLIPAKSFKQASEFIEVDSKAYNFRIASDGGGDVVLQLPDTSLQSGAFYTVIVRGYKTAPGGNTHVLSAEVIVN